MVSVLIVSLSKLGLMMNFRLACSAFTLNPSRLASGAYGFKFESGVAVLHPTSRPRSKFDSARAKSIPPRTINSLWSP